jgi:hypothetical protein
MEKRTDDMSSTENDQATAEQNPLPVKQDPTTPVEDLDPVELVEVDEDGPEPPPEWGQDGQGSEAPTNADDGAETTGGAV